MENTENDSEVIIDDINKFLEQLLLNQKFDLLDVEEFPKELVPICEKLNSLTNNLKELNIVLTELSKGNLEIDMPPRKNYLASSVKQLYSNLNHLTWQTERIANGEYGHKVDFLGDFSKYFNQMTAQLEKRENELYSTNKILKKVFNYIDPLIIISAENRYNAYYINEYAKEIFNIDTDNADEDFYDISEVAKNSKFFETLLNTKGHGEFAFELYNSEIDKWFSINSTAINWVDNSEAIILYCSDISIQKLREVELQKDAHTDSLTGINNRYALDISLKAKWQVAKQINRDLSIIIIDIDKFKNYNDTFGHLQGDICLRSVAQCIQNSCTNSNIEDVLAARFGGEEFIIFMANSDAEEAYNFSEVVRKNIMDLEIANIVTATDNVPSNAKKFTKVTVSLGVASCNPYINSNIEEKDLLALADKALYYSKANGRNRSYKLVF